MNENERITVINQQDIVKYSPLSGHETHYAGRCFEFPYFFVYFTKNDISFIGFNSR